ncbi:hypothetical protein GCM10027346_36290 [Hymenobacter seoulensis]
MVLTGLNATLRNLEFSSIALRSAVHCAAWLLAFSATEYFAQRTPWRAFKRLWRGVLWVQWGALALAVVTVYPVVYGAVPLFFFATREHGYPDDYGRPVLCRGREAVYYRHLDWDNHPTFWKQAVQIQPLAPGLNWVTPLGENPLLDSTWTALDSVGVELLAPRYRNAAQASLANKFFNGKPLIYTTSLPDSAPTIQTDTLAPIDEWPAD